MSISNYDGVKNVELSWKNLNPGIYKRMIKKTYLKTSK